MSSIGSASLAISDDGSCSKSNDIWLGVVACQLTSAIPANFALLINNTVQLQPKPATTRLQHIDMTAVSYTHLTLPTKRIV